MSTFKVTLADGNVAEVEASAIEAPENFIVADASNGIDGFVRQEVMDQTIKTRVSSAKQNALKDAYKDESVRNQIFSELGIELGDDGKPKNSGKSDFDYDKEKEKWENSSLNPLKEELQTSKDLLDNISIGLKNQSILGAFAGKAKDDYLDDEFGDPYVVTTLANQFKFNPELGKVLQVDKNGDFEMHPNGKKGSGHGYIEPSHFIEINATKDFMKRVLKDTTQGGSNLKPGGSQGANTLNRKDFDALTPTAQAKHFEDGGKVVD